MGIPAARKLGLPILASPSRERAGHDTWGKPLDGSDGPRIGYDLEDVCGLIEAAGATILAIDVQHVSDSFMFWLEWAEGSERVLPVSFTRVPWRDLPHKPL